MRGNLKVLSIDPANVQTAYVLFCSDSWKIYDKGIIPNKDFLKLLEQGDYDEVALEIIVNMGISGKSLYDTAEMVGMITYIVRKKGKPLHRISRNEVKKHFKVKRSSKHNKQPSADSQIRTSLIERFGKVGTKGNPGYFYGFKADKWAAMSVGVYHIDTKKEP